MADLPSHPDTGDEIGLEPVRGSSTGRPWWVYALWIGVILLVMLFVVLHLTGAIGPGSH